MPSRTVTTLPFSEYPVASGNFDSNRTPIDMIILHTEDGFKKGTEATFNNSSSHVSAHYGVNLDGTLDHFLEETLVAYHAGDYLINQRSIGIEHEDLGKPNDPRTDELYVESAKLVADICQFYAIPCDRNHIKKHSEVSQLGTLCPDSLDVDKIVAKASAILSPPPTPTPSTPTLTTDEVNTLKFLHNAFVALKTPQNVPFGNLEGMTREVVEDYPKYLQFMASRQNPTTTVTTSPVIEQPLSPITATDRQNLFSILRKMLGLG